MSKTALILQGPPGVGKDTIAEILVRKHKFTRHAFADKVRQFAEAINPTILVYDIGRGWHNQPMTLAEALQRYNDWDELKRRVPSVRPLLQRIGTEGGRETLGVDCWVKPVLQDIAARPPADGVFSDARFPNEYDAIIDSPHYQEIYVLNITRPGFERVNDHVSESYAIAANVKTPWIPNDGSIENLESLLDIAMRTRTWPDKKGFWLSWDVFMEEEVTRA